MYQSICTFSKVNIIFVYGLFLELKVNDHIVLSQNRSSKYFVILIFEISSIISYKLAYRTKIINIYKCKKKHIRQSYEIQRIQ